MGVSLKKTPAQDRLRGGGDEGGRPFSFGRDRSFGHHTLGKKDIKVGGERIGRDRHENPPVEPGPLMEDLTHTRLSTWE